MYWKVRIAIYIYIRSYCFRIFIKARAKERRGAASSSNQIKRFRAQKDRRNSQKERRLKPSHLTTPSWRRLV